MMNIETISRTWLANCMHLYCGCLLLTGVVVPVMNAQDPTTTVTDTAVAAAPEAEMLRTRMALTANQLSDGTIALEALLRAKAESGYVKMPDQEVNFFQVNAELEETGLANARTGLNGIAMASVQWDQLPVTPDGVITLLARFEGNDQLAGSETELTLQRAKLVVDATEADSVKTMTIQAMAESSGGPVPIAAAPVVVYVKRMFSELRVAEGETDETGLVALEFPGDLMGDEAGNLDIRVAIEETEAYGNLVAKLTQPWGKPVSYAVEDLPRALWSPDPPRWMVVTFFVLMVTVWAHYGVIIWKMTRIKADSSASADPG